MQAGDRIGGRYVIERELGAGSAGRVYRAMDSRTQNPVALKFLNADALTAAAIERAGLLALEHPALVRMLDSGSHGGQAYVVSELVTGGSLASLPKPATPEMLEQLAAQMLGALAFLHGQGILHADVKTENIFVASASPPVFKLGDFGLSRRIKDLAASAAAGSPAFMPPEVIRGEPVDERGDLYSLGVVLYECAFGRLPFDGPTVSAVFLGHLNDEPEGLRNPGAVRPREAALLRRLLAKDPAARPRDARAALTAWRGEEAAVPDSALPRLGVLIGRDAELAACEAALAGPGRILVLEGPPGVGKTRLLRELAVRARVQELRVVWWTPDEVSSGDLNMPTVPSSSIAEGGRQVIDWALDRVMRLHNELGSTGWVVLVDDLGGTPPWFVHSTLEFCRAMLASGDHHTLVCLAGREELSAITEHFVDVPTNAVLRLELGNWDLSGVESALSALYGARQIDPRLSSLVHEATSGNPGVVEQYAQHLIETGSLRATAAGQLALTAGARSDVWRPTQTGWIERALIRCTEAERRLLQCICALRSSASSNLLTRIVPTAEGSLAPLVRAGLVQSVSGVSAARYSAAGTVVRNTVLGALTPMERSLLHAEISAAIQDREDTDAEERAFHAALAAEGPALIPALERLALLAAPETVRQAHDAVVSRVSATTDPVLRARLTLLRLAALRRIGDIPASITLAQAELSGCPAQFEADMRGLLAEAHYEQGNASDALETLGPAVVMDSTARAGLRARVLWALERYEEGLTVADAALAPLPPGDVHVPALREAKIALLRSMGRIAEAVELVEVATRTAIEFDRDRDLATHLLTWGNIEFYQGQFVRADERFAQALEVLGRLADRPGLLRALSHKAAAAGESGRYIESRECLLRALDLSRSLGEFRTQCTLLCNSALLGLILARYAEALQHVQSSLRLFKTVQNERALLRAHIVVGQLHSRLGSYSAAHAALDLSLQQQSRSLPNAMACLALAALQLSEGHPQAASGSLDWAEPVLAECGAEDELLEAKLLRGRIARAAGNIDGAIAATDAVSRAATAANLFLVKLQADVLLSELVAPIEPEVAEQLADLCLVTADRHALPEEAWRSQRVLGRCRIRLGDVTGGVAAYRRAWATVEGIFEELPEELVSGYLATPDLAELLAEIESLPQS